MKFWAYLILVEKNQTEKAKTSISDNCILVDNQCWIYEGLTESLEWAGVKFIVLGSGAVPSVYFKTTEELKTICKDVFKIDVDRIKNYA